MKRSILIITASCCLIGCHFSEDSSPPASHGLSSNLDTIAERDKITKRIEAIEKSMNGLEEKSRGMDVEVSRLALQQWNLQFNDWRKFQDELRIINQKLGVNDSSTAITVTEQAELEKQIASAAADVLKLNQKLAFATGDEKTNYKLAILFRERKIQMWQLKLEGKSR